ncbi:MAG: rhomboid family intramembrane serine protease [Rhodobacteraceae bacterium GWE1_64_9]|nr:MAG: rhomboid family intramembrane serine protease [Rhodobacteraceae bacterium GWE1_64_9]OHC50457.1 MAG: rhomboid family intramembrane serine protease [Rhodobacteraceae bacterium GWF1_65_7]HBD90413.1 rhomboid family intramembrane serine protease [Gemmobacter sp.]HBU15764.1 rhomboid family intramembrane serine protease [Gemmobacter sp.]
MYKDLNAAPINPLPWVVWLICLPVIAMEVVLSAGGSGLVGGPGAIGWRLEALQRLAFSPDMLRLMVSEGVWPMDGLVRLVGYVFVHGSATHAIFVVVMLLALGKMVGEIFRWWAVLLVFFGSAVVGALVYAAVPFTQYGLVGGYPAVYGLIGAFTFLIWVRLAGTGTNQWRAFTMIGFLLVAQLLFGLLFGGSTEWVADIAGFGTGFLLSFVVSPGGFARVKARLRER